MFLIKGKQTLWASSLFYCLFFPFIWNASQICVSPLHRGHVNFCIVQIFVYVPQEWAHSLFYFLSIVVRLQINLCHEDQQPVSLIPSSALSEAPQKGCPAPNLIRQIRVSCNPIQAPLASLEGSRRESTVLPPPRSRLKAHGSHCSPEHSLWSLVNVDENLQLLHWFAMGKVSLNEPDFTLTSFPVLLWEIKVLHRDKFRQGTQREKRQSNRTRGKQYFQINPELGLNIQGKGGGRVNAIITDLGIIKTITLWQSVGCGQGIECEGLNFSHPSQQGKTELRVKHVI